MESEEARIKPQVIAVFLVGLTFILLTIAEIGARLAFVYKHQIALAVDPKALNWDQMVDPTNPRNWRLRPGTTLTFRQLLENEHRQGKKLAVNRLKRMATKYTIEDDAVIYHINNDGFKGPELRSDAKVRIVTLGDSCTFGPALDQFSYPRVMEKSLKDQVVDVEVVNAGVNGYTAWNILMRIQDLKKLKPDVVTIYVGWNSIFELAAVRQERILQSPLLLQAIGNRLYAGWMGKNSAALADYTKRKHVDMTSSEVKSLSSYEPPFLEDVSMIIKEMETLGARVVLITLPGLFITSEWPSQHALEIGHLPPYTNNPSVLAAITERYNVALRQLAKASNVYLIDLEAWSKKMLIPRDAFFIDSVHLTEEGQEMIGKFMADQMHYVIPLSDSN